MTCGSVSLNLPLPHDKGSSDVQARELSALRCALRALRVGRVTVALQALQSVSDASSTQSAEIAFLFEQIRRLGAAHIEHVNDFATEDHCSWRAENSGDISYSYLVSDGAFRVVAQADCELDTLRAIAGLLEFDLWKEYKPKIVSSEVLGEHDPVETLWRIRQTSSLTGSKNDNIVGVSFTDALDEPIASLCVCLYAPEGADGSKPLRGMTIPPAEPGWIRETNWRTSFFFSPNSKGNPGSRMRVANCAELTSAMFTMLYWMPPMAKRKFINDYVNKTVQGFLDHVKSCQMLTQRIEESHRSKFYEEVGVRLALFDCIDES
mmetsp:Transcript_17941/g.35036  ORF Transcript_17941/g.35036 Transcript_17941/m.35036 type:complete len:321 (+) Transcript_17941:41-1003(+)